jgi:hypothetical protein
MAGILRPPLRGGEAAERVFELQRPLEAAVGFNVGKYDFRGHELVDIANIAIASKSMLPMQPEVPGIPTCSAFPDWYRWHSESLRALGLPGRKRPAQSNCGPADR